MIVAWTLCDNNAVWGIKD